MELLIYDEVFFLVEYYCASKLSIAKLVKFRAETCPYKFKILTSLLDLFLDLIMLLF